MINSLTSSNPTSINPFYIIIGNLIFDIICSWQASMGYWRGTGIDKATSGPAVKHSNCRILIINLFISPMMPSKSIPKITKNTSQPTNSHIMSFRDILTTIIPIKTIISKRIFSPKWKKSHWISSKPTI